MLGAIIGDVVGSRLEYDNIRRKNFELFTEKCCYTDDSLMTTIVAKVLLDGVQDDKEKIIDYFKYYGRRNPAAYGPTFARWIYSDYREPYNSFGNGSAMRISPVGWLANSEEEVKELSKKITEVTHNHPEGLKGAEVTAMCIYYARTGKSKDFIKKYAEQYYNLDFDYEDLRKNYKYDITCQGTVPQCIYCFLISNSFEDCLRTAVSIGGDTDTVAAISCSIAEAYYGLNENDLEIAKKALEFCSDDMLEIVKQVVNKGWLKNLWKTKETK